MEYLVLLAAMALFFIVIFVMEASRAKRRQEQFVRSLYDDFGKNPEKEYSPERFARIGGYYNRHRNGEQIDDITWNDLNMDDVFKRMNYTLSATGEEYLYYTLRNAGQSLEELAHLEDVAAWFQEHADERVQVQLLMNGLGYTGKFSLYDYMDHLDQLGERSNAKHHLFNALYLPLIALIPFLTAPAVLGIAVLSVRQILSYFKEKGEIEPYIISFAYVARLMETCRKLIGINLPVCSAEQQELQQHIRNLRGVTGGSYWVFSSAQSRSNGSPLDIVMDYARMVFHVDLIIFNKMLAQLRTHLEDIDGLVALAGYLEMATAVCAFRASLKNGWCIPKLRDGAEADRGLFLSEGYHPFLAAPVKNTVRADGCVLLTGSNASGKSTFLKTVALNAILAQTIHTCTAAAYSASCFRIYSSMALRDDISSGESYYIVEIKAIKRILDASRRETERPILCFVDEVLRGTNTVERIAASTQILKWIAGNGILCFAATHDIELTELLQEQYSNYHFEEDVREGDIFFPYKLLDGRATTRNAIKLLEIMGFEPEIIDNAGRMAQRFVETKVWQG